MDTQVGNSYRVGLSQSDERTENGSAALSGRIQVEVETAHRDTQACRDSDLLPLRVPVLVAPADPPETSPVQSSGR